MTDFLSALDQPTAQATGLPGRFYHLASLFEEERRHLFPKSWVPVAFTSEVSSPGDLLPVLWARWEILLVRDESGALLGFHNLCRHRGMPLVAAKTNRRNIVCPYHCWGYRLTGELLATPNIGGIGNGEAEGMDKSTLGLVSIRTEEWNGIVFVNLDGLAPSLDSFLKPVEARLSQSGFDLSLLAVVDSDPLRELSLKANWKLFVESAIEDYHLPYVHPHTIPEYAADYAVSESPGAYIEFTTKRSIGDAAKRYRKGADGAQAELPMWPITLETGIAESVVIFLQPLGLMLITPSMMIFSLVLPQSATRTQLRTQTRFIGEGATSPDYSRARETIRNLFAQIIQEDIPMMERLQETSELREELNLPTRFSPHWERGLHLFQLSYSRMMQRSWASPPPGATQNAGEASKNP